MKRTVLSKLPFFFLALMVVVLMVATWVEHLHGSEVAYRTIYHSVGFQVLWGIIVLTGLGVIVRQKLWRKPHSLVLHGALIIILLGALITSLTATNGTLHLRQGQASRHFIDDSRMVVSLPFAVKLQQFRVHNYPGTDTPADYESVLLIEGEKQMVSMNNIAEVSNYRFYQSSYDTDQKGTVLSVYHDPWGIPVTYVGYALLLVGFLWTLFAPRSMFYRLLRHPALRQTTFLLLLIVGFLGHSVSALAHPEYAGQSGAVPPPTLVAPAQHQGQTAPAAAVPPSMFANVAPSPTEKLQAASRADADKIARRLIVYNGRVCPFNTLAMDFCKKIYGRPSFRGLTAEQVVLSWLFFPEQWQRVPMIRIKDAALRQALGVKGDYAALEQLYLGSQYRLQVMLQQERDPASPLARAIQETDEKVGLILMLHKGTLIRPLADSAHEARLSEAQITAEIIYNRVPTIKIGFMLCLTLGFAAFVLLIAGVQRRWITIIERSLLAFSFVFLLVWFGFRWYLSGYVPLSNGFETMLFLAICVQGVSLLLMRRFSFVLPFGAILSGFALLVAHLSDMNPQLTSLMPVLSSPLLSLHVTLMMLSYALFAMMALNSAYALMLMLRPRRAHRVHYRNSQEMMEGSALSLTNSATISEAKHLRSEHAQPQRDSSQRLLQLTLLNRLLLYPSVALLSIGIFIGAIWANVSWGRYWGWDPKEVWALITMLIYAFPLHPGQLRGLSQPRAFHLYLLLAFLSVLFTYFGVNYILGGMHSYANG